MSKAFISPAGAAPGPFRARSGKYRKLVHRRFVTLWLGLGLSVLWASCAPSVELRDTVDLVTELPGAEVLAESADFGIGTVHGRRHLGAGWWKTEGQPGHRFVWGVRDVSTLSFRVIGRRSLELVLDLRPFSYPESPPQRVTVELNGRQIHRFELEPPARRRINIPLPEAVLQSGLNQLDLQWQWSRSPRDVLGVRDSRPLAAALHGAWLCDPAVHRCGDGFDPNSSSPSGRPRADRGRLWLPGGTDLDFYLDLPEACSLLAEVAFRGRGKLEVSTLRDREPAVEHHVGSLDSPVEKQAQALEWPLDVGAGLIRLRLRASAGGRRAGAMIERPRIACLPGRSGEAIEPGRDTGVETSSSHVQAEARAPAGLVLYSIDTLRADRLGYRGGAVATPVFDAFAEQSLVFDDLIAQSSWTRASMGTIFTGLWPPSHGAVNRRNRLEDRMVTLAEILHASGWATMAVVTNPNVNELFGFAQGFERFVDIGEEPPAEEVTDIVAALLRERGDDPRPLFLWVHTIDPHSPYDPPTEFRRRHLPHISDELAASSLDVVNELRAERRPVADEIMGRLVELYDHEIVYADQAFRGFLELLAEHGLAEAVVTVISDHGEEFLEHGNLEHGRNLHVESLDVPWMIRGPGLAPQRLAQPAQHLDVLPTLLAAVGVERPSGLQGHTWVGTDGSVRPPTEPRWVYSHLHLDGDEHLSVSDGSYKMMVVVKSGKLVRRRLFDQRRDPRETTDLASRYPVLAGRLTGLLRSRLAGAVGDRGAEVEFDDETRRSLEALGYL